MLAGIGSASAADMPPPRRPAPTPVVVPEVYTWSGCYIGGHFGAVWAHEKYVDPLAAPPDDQLGSHSASRIAGGGQFGCDYQAGNWVFGAQGAFTFVDPKVVDHFALGDFLGTETRWLATATGRIGYAWHPRWMTYVKGGGAWLRHHETITDGVTGLLEGTADVTRSGWTVGGGGEYLIAQNWSLYAEYNYLNFGRRSVAFTNLEVPPIPPTFPLNIQQDVHQAVVGLSYRFVVPR
jgi:outer membrane immunogenic protein